MVTRRAFLAALPVALSASDRPTVGNQAELLKEAATRALLYTKELPDFVCTETVKRSDNVRSIGWKLKDILGVQVGISERREYYKLLTYNGRPTSLSYRSVGGSLTEGEFGSLLAEIFHPDSAKFKFKQTMMVAGRNILVFEYRVPAEKSTYRLEFGYRAGKPQSVMVGHKGLVWIDEATARVMRVEQAAEIPRSFPVRVSKTILEYAWLEIAGTLWLLPKHASSTMGTTEVLTNNEVEFRDYRKFTADSAVVFETP